jgi:hypothetical protein
VLCSQQLAISGELSEDSRGMCKDSPRHSTDGHEDDPMDLTISIINTEGGRDEQ